MRRPALAALVLLLGACDGVGPDGALLDLPGATADVEALQRSGGWVLEAVYQEGRLFEATEEEAHLFAAVFGPDGAFGASTAANSLGGEHEADSTGRLRVDVRYSTLAGEPSGRLGDIAAAHIGALGDAQRFETDGRTLQLTGRGGTAVRLRARER